MAIQFASRMELLKGSPIRALLALANKPEVISFAGGMPAPELFPVKQMKIAVETVMDEQGRTAMQYSSTDGFLHFREQIADRMEAKKWDTHRTRQHTDHIWKPAGIGLHRPRVL